MYSSSFCEQGKDAEMKGKFKSAYLGGGGGVAGGGGGGGEGSAAKRY